jgi:hypothetical protein
MINDIFNCRKIPAPQYLIALIYLNNNKDLALTVDSLHESHISSCTPNPDKSSGRRVCTPTIMFTFDGTPNDMYIIKIMN